MNTATLEEPAVGGYEDPLATNSMGLSTAAYYVEPEIPIEPVVPQTPQKQGLENSAMGGLVMMGLAAAWFVGGLACGYLFFYPPVMFVIGFVTFIKES